MYDQIQTFFINPASVDNATEVLATSVFLYFKRKPHERKNRSGIQKPGVTLQLIECDGENPNPSKPLGLPVRVEYDDIYALRDASAPTIFTFDTPITIETNRFYGVAIQYDDRGFKVWLNQQGRRVIGRNINSPGKSGPRDGCLYRAIHRHYAHYWLDVVNMSELTGIDFSNSPLFRRINHDRGYKALKNKDLKYIVNVAKFNTNPDGTGGSPGGGGVGNTTPATTISLVNDDYEFFTINAISGVFRGGETVFANNSLATGTVEVQAGNSSVLGTGTTFTDLVDGDAIVITSGNTHYAGIINAVSNNTVLTLTDAPSFTNSAATFRQGITGDVVKVDYVKQKMIIKNSSAKTGAVFATGNQIRGELSNAYATIASVDNLTVDKFVANIKLNSEIAANTNVTYDIAHANGANFAVDESYDPVTDGQEINLTSKPGYILSRSNEVGQSDLFGDDLKSAVIKVDVASSNSAHAAPHINASDADITVGGYKVSMDYEIQAANGMYYDSETDNHGIALSKHITKHFRFGQDQRAEDLRVFLYAHKPMTTELRVYAKLHNSSDNDTFDDKKWTLLECVDNANVYSSAEDLNDIVGYEYGIPAAPESESTATGSFTTSSGNSVVVGTGTTVNSELPVGRLVKIYSPYFEDNYLVGRVVAANTTSFTLDNEITDSNVLGSGFLVDLLKYTNSAFNNKQNDNVVRYYNSTGAPFDKYDSMQLKIVQLAETTNIIPRIRHMEGIGVSA